MSLALLLGALGAIALVAGVRQALRSRRRGDAPWRTAALLAGQLALAALLWPVLQPPPGPATDATLVVLTAGAPRPPADAGMRVVALPEAPGHAGIDRVPDLGTALRRHPDAVALRVLGAGLPPRDRDAARGLRIAFEPTPLPVGIVELAAPARLAAGRRFTIAGRVEGAPGARLELLDPAGTRIDLQPAGDDGRFAVAGIAGPPGRVGWTLRRRDAADAIVETLDLPVEVVAGAPLRVLALAGGANPEQKHFARWALDAGMTVQARARVGGGVDLGVAVPPLTAGGLRDVDLVVLDDRAWRELGDGGRAALREAVRDGVGVLLRLTGDPSPADRAALAAWGFDVAAADIARGFELPGTAVADPPAAPGTAAAGDAEAADGGTVDATADARAPVVLSRRALAIVAADGVPLLHATDGGVIARWRAEGRGRIAVWNVADTFRLQLAGRRAAYGSLWADAVGTLARPRVDGALPAPADARVGERLALCGLGAGATLRDPDGTAVPLHVDPATGPRACAAAWPARAGWYALDDGERRAAFVVRAGDAAPGLAAAASREATAALAAQAVPARRGGTPPPGRPGPRWPWLLAWLAVAAAVWGLERARAGTRR